ncbi:MAG: phenylalanine--tRNA ligase subunit beta [Alcanivoracaceae bacterium]|nr:phenylalanine--tRNA ligase subunit beta [Alcanivoracaceae bacterium]
MKLSESWLREWVNPDITRDQLVHQITMAGLEVDAVESVAPAFTDVVVAEVIETVPHPDADKLTLCRVDAGDGVFPVVCGASNVRKGLRVPFARVGAELPGGLTIKKAKLRGEPSEGMLCGASELGLEDQVDGLMELPADAPVGEDIRRYLKLDDHIIEVDLTPNRADCLSVRGIAREVGVLNQVPVHPPEQVAVTEKSKASRTVRVEQPQDCPRYLGRVIDNVDAGAQTPLWMVERLRRAGIGSIDPIVDVTNYVLLELGQPLHAFDNDRLVGDVVVRHARAGESLVLLDGQSLTLDEDVLVIADDSGALAMAGVMGGESSAVSKQTRSVFLECAFFNPLAIAGKARRYGLHTDSSHRFERGVDPALQEQAIDRATSLIQAIAGGEAGPLVVQEDAPSVPRPAEIELRADRIERLLGMSLPASEVEEHLGRLGMEVTTREDGRAWSVLAPSWRFDMEREEDLVEELARIHGYDRLPSRLPMIQGRPRMPENRLDARRISDLLLGLGYHEAITYTFVDPQTQAALEPSVAPLPLANPISADLSVMRTTLWAGMLAAARYNLNRQAERLRLFETGLRFRPDGDALAQVPCVAGLVYGSAAPAGWQGKPAPVDFYRVKGDVEALLHLGGHDHWGFQAEAHEALHPGQSARILRDGQPVGWLGKIHPRVAKALDISADIFLYEVEISAILSVNVPKYVEISTQPRVRRDLAFVVADTISAQQVIDVVRNGCDDLLTDVRIFDVYQGDSVGEGKRSLALGLTFQDRSRTLRDADVNTQVESVVSLLKQEFNAHLRD